MQHSRVLLVSAACSLLLSTHGVLADDSHDLGTALTSGKLWVMFTANY